MAKLSTAARHIKSDIDQLIGAWGIAAILEVLEDRIWTEQSDPETFSPTGNKLAHLLNEARQLTD